MKFKVSKETLVNALVNVQGIVERRNMMPILSNVLLAANNGALEVTATDLEVGAKTSYSVTVVDEGRITIAAKKLYEIIKEMPNAEITFIAKENDWVEIQCEKVRFNIAGVSADEYPLLRKFEGEGPVIPAAILRKLLTRTAYAMSNDETKYHLNGIFWKAFQGDGEFRLLLVATDGHRLAMDEHILPGTATPDLVKGVIVPRKGISELLKVLESCEEMTLGFVDNNMIFVKQNGHLVIRLIEGNYPDYSKILPTTNSLGIKVSRPSLISSFKRMSILSSDKTMGVKLDLEEKKMTILCFNPDFGDSAEEVAVTYDGPSFSIRFNPKYIMDTLSVLPDDEVSLYFKGDNITPLLIDSEAAKGSTAVIMPMRL